MAILGRNELCYCGSGKKYKKCCLRSDEENSKNGEFFTPSGESFEVAASSHDISLGVKQLALAQLEQINIWLSRTHIQTDLIQFNSKDLHDLVTSEDMMQHYLQINREILTAREEPYVDLEMMHLSKKAKLMPTLTENERAVIGSVTRSHLGEFWMLGDAQTADYNAMRMLNEFCYQAVKEGITDSRPVSKVTLYIDSNGSDRERLVNWELDYSDSSDRTKNLWIEWKALDKLNDEYFKIAHALHGLAESSKNELATVLYQEKSLPAKSRHRISYGGLVMTYSRILERELKALIELKEGRQGLELMMKKINEYLRDNPVPYVSENVPDLYEKLERVRKIRNAAAHGNEVGYEEFKMVKSFLVEQQMLEFVSWAKIHYEDHEQIEA